MYEDIAGYTSVDLKSIFNVLLCGISYCDGTYKIIRNNSAVYCFEYIIEGSGTVVTPRGKYHPKKGDIYILKAGDDHYYYSDDKNPWVKIWFNIDGSLVKNLMEAYGIYDLEYVEGLDLYPLFEQFFIIAKKGKLKPETIIQEQTVIFHKIIIELSSYVTKKEDVFTSEAVKLKNYIDMHTNENIKLADLSKLIFRSSSQTIRIFKKAYNSTPMDYLIVKKIETAKLLLKNTNMMIKEIAYKLNFADEHYFSGVFKLKTGITPKDYRNL